MNKPFAAIAGPDNGPTSTCWDCGHTWKRGTDGSHSCVQVLQERLASAFYVAHLGDPCLLCGTAHDDVSVGGCQAAPHQIWSAIGNLEDQANALYEGGEVGCTVAARRLFETKRRLERLHELLGFLLVPALPPSSRRVE